MKTVKLEVKNYPKSKKIKLKNACNVRDCDYKDILVPAVDEYLSTKKKSK